MMRMKSKMVEYRMSLEKNSASAVPDGVTAETKLYTRAGWLILLFGFGGFLLWASLAPLDKGVPLSGTVVKESNRKSVQHLNGGTIQRILVKDGDVVKAGQVLLTMNSIATRAAFDTSDSQFLAARVTEARLAAERDGKDVMTLPVEMASRKGEQQVAEALLLQQQILRFRKISLQSELDGINESIEGTESQISGLQNSQARQQDQVSINYVQLTNLRELAKDGYIARNRVMDLERTDAQLNAKISEDLGTIGKLKRQVVELKFRRNQRIQDYHKEVSGLLVENRKEIDVLRARLETQRLELSNVDVRSPANGIVVGSTVFTEGGVISPGFRLMDVLPTDDPLIIEGQLPVNLIDKVHIGLAADLLFSSFNASRTPHIDGTVSAVWPDRSVDERTGAPYYKIRISVASTGAAVIARQKLEIIAGMPVEIFVKTGERTMMNYLLKPVFDRARLSLSEE